MAKDKTPIDDDMDGEDLQAQILALQHQVQALLQHVTAPVAGGISEDRLEQILGRVAQMSADAQERAANPSNKTHPGISVYSYPEGDRARPRALKCPMLWCGQPVGLDTSTAEEIELMNLAEPGEYEFKRSDNTRDVLTVVGERGPAGNLTKLLFSFIVKDRAEPRSIPDMLRYALQIKTPQELEMEALRREVAQLREGVAA